MNGILIVNKTKGYTSHDIVAKVKKITHEKVGHTGTLDPLATGVLPLLIGKGTLCSKYLINHDKKYIVLLKIGEKTSTGDSEGDILEKLNVDINVFYDVENIFNSFIGEQEQIPPIYSAIKVNGKKLYEYARKNQEVKIEPRKINIYSIKILKLDKEKNEIQFEVKCSKGTYIRSLCEDIATRLGTVGYMKELNRIEVGEFNINQAIDVENLTENDISKKIINIEEIFEKNSSIELTKRKLELFLNGVNLTVQNQNGIYKIYSENKFIGIGIVKDKLLKRDIVI